MSDMRIFKVTRAEDDRIEYDEFDSFVCAAPESAAARRLHPRGRYVWNEDTRGWHWVDRDTDVPEESRCEYHSWTCDIDSLEVELIGTSPRPGYHGAVVILASFNAG